ncbi:MAG: hypothetical protein H6670_02650 [Anaerolineaceae bacterium]|nr:hypothetical protein [Anaerolineaceae bacterium]
MSLAIEVALYVFKPWFARLLIVLDVIVVLSLFIEKDIPISREMLIIISVLLLILVLLQAIFRLYSEKNPKVDFEIETTRFLQLGSQTKLFEVDLKSKGTIEFNPEINIRNTRSLPTSVEFTIVDIDSDLPMVVKDYSLKLGSTATDNTTTVEAGSIKKKISLYFMLDIRLKPAEEILPKIRSASRLEVVFHARQPDSGYIEYRIPAHDSFFADLKELIKTRIQQRIDQAKTEEDKQKFIDYLFLIDDRYGKE